MSHNEQEQPTKPPQRSRLGNYEILSKLGQGGMGAVFKAVQLSVGRTVALKVLPPRLAKNREYVERFFREARAAAQLSHPHIVQAIDAGEADGYYYFAMEFVEGQPVSKLLEGGNALPEKYALEICRDIAHALNYAHERGIIHRDVKPANILLSTDGPAKLADLGLARETGSTASHLTQAGYAIGTPDYISPEQVRGETDLDGRTDIYSLGATLYHMLTGRPPYTGGSGNEVMAKHLSEPIPDARRANPQVSHAAARVVWKAMAKEPRKRYATAGDMAFDIERVLAGAAGAGAARPRPEPVGKSHGNRLLAYAGGAVVAALAVLLVVALSSGPGPGGPKHGKKNGGTATKNGKKTLPSDASILEAARRFARENPQQIEEIVRRYRTAIDRMTDPQLLTRARQELTRYQEKQARRLDRQFAAAEEKARERERQADYDGAIACYRGLPTQLAARAALAVESVRARAEKRINPVLAAARDCLQRNLPRKGLEELDKLKSIRYAPLQARVQPLRVALEKKQRELDQQRQRDIAAAKVAVGKLLDAIEAAAAGHDLARAGRLADAALKNDKLKLAGPMFGAVTNLGRNLARIAAAERASVVRALKARMGRRVELETRTRGVRKGTIKEVTRGWVVLDRTYYVAGQPRKRPDDKVRIEELSDKQIAKLRTPWVPQTPDERIAAAVLAYGNKNPAAMRAALHGAEAHLLYPRYQAKLRALETAAANQARERAAQNAWKAIQPFVDLPRLSRSQAKQALPLVTSFQKEHGTTRFAASRANEIATLKKKITEAFGPMRFSSTIKLQVLLAKPDDRKFCSMTEIGSTPAKQPIVIPPKALWVVRPTERETFTDQDLRALAAVIVQNDIPGLTLSGCRRITNNGLAVLRQCPSLVFLGLGRTSIGQRGLAHISQMKELREVSFAGVQSRITWAPLRRLSKLKALSLWKTCAKDSDMLHVATLQALERLNIGRTEITDKGLAYLSRLPRLRVLHVYNTTITDAGLLQLRRVRTLRVLRIKETQVTPRGLATLKEALPKLQIITR